MFKCLKRGWRYVGVVFPDFGENGGGNVLDGVAADAF